VKVLIRKPRGLYWSKMEQDPRELSLSMSIHVWACFEVQDFNPAGIQYWEMWRELSLSDLPLKSRGVGGKE